MHLSCGVRAPCPPKSTAGGRMRVSFLLVLAGSLLASAPVFARDASLPYRNQPGFQCNRWNALGECSDWSYTDYRTYSTYGGSTYTSPVYYPPSNQRYRMLRSSINENSRYGMVLRVVDDNVIVPYYYSRSPRYRTDNSLYGSYPYYSSSYSNTSYSYPYYPNTYSYPNPYTYSYSYPYTYSYPSTYPSSSTYYPYPYFTRSSYGNYRGMLRGYEYNCDPSKYRCE